MIYILKEKCKSCPFKAGGYNDVSYSYNIHCALERIIGKGSYHLYTINELDRMFERCPIDKKLIVIGGRFE